VTPYFREHPERFRLGNVPLGRDLSTLRWTVDWPEDLEFVRQIYFRLNSPTAGMREILEILEQNPELVRLNAGLPTGQGNAKSRVPTFPVTTENP